MGAGAKVSMKVISIVIGIPVGIATKKAVERAWLTARPDDPPRKPTEADVHWSDASRWAALSGRRASSLADLITRRSSRGRLPGDHRQRTAAAQAEQGREEAAEGQREGQGTAD